MPRKKKVNKEADVVPINEAVKQDMGEKEEVNPNQKSVSLDDLKVAYVVGMSYQGDFIFQLLGKEPGLVELLGIHQHAVRKVQHIYEDKQIGGDRLTHEVGKSVAVLNQKLDHLISIIAPKQPDNKLG